MTALSFEKYQGTGNDFIMIDNRKGWIDKENIALVKKLCDRKFGIGSDGLILIENHGTCDFEMIYYNPDGSKSLCGNGSRCAVKFANQLKIIGDKTLFMTIDGPLDAYIQENLVQLKMPDVRGVSHHGDDLYIHTGSPHFIKFVDQIDSINVVKQGRDIRYRSDFAPEGTNVNFVQRLDGNSIFVRTYERGVEDETLSCGTGVTASALAAARNEQKGTVDIETRGGKLRVSFRSTGEGGYKDIYLTGPAEKVFDGVIHI